MARVEDIKVRIGIQDDLSPYLRRLRFGFWMASHVNTVLAIGFALTALAGIGFGAAAVLWVLR